MLKSLQNLIEKIVSSRFLSFAVFAAAGLLAYKSGLNGEFLWDDSWLVQQNPFFKSPLFIFEVFKHYLYLEGTSTYYRPLQNISYMPDYWLWNSNTFGYHLSNVFFHVISGWLLFRLVTKLLPVFADSKPAGAGGSPAPGFLTRHCRETAFLVALIWVVHPIHNAAVAYVAGRADSLASMFCIAAWLLYLRARQFAVVWARAAAFVAAFFLCLLAICSKEIAITWFCLFAFYTFVFDKGPRMREKLAAAASLVLVVCCCLWLRHLPVGTASGAAPAGTPSTFEYRGILAFRALGDYAGLVIFPSHLHMDRTVYQVGPYSSAAAWQGSIRLEYLSVIGALTFAMFVFFCWKDLPGRRLRIFGVVWFLIGFLPISNLFPLNAQVAEHWIYMPSFGFLLFLAGCVMVMPPRLRMAAVTIAVLAIPAFAVRTAYRAYEWADPERFYLQTIEDGGGSARVHLNLALVHSARATRLTGEAAKKEEQIAEEMLRHTVKNSPDYLPAKLNLGINLLRQRRTKEAEAFLKIDPNATKKVAAQQAHTWSAALNLAHMRHNEKAPEEALAILNEALPTYPGIWDLVELKARILKEEAEKKKEPNEKEAQTKESIASVRAYADSHWWHYDSHMALSRLLAGAGDADGAVEALRHAGTLDIHAAVPFVEIMRIRLGEKKFAEAEAAIQRAIQRDPYQPKQYFYLADIYEKLGRKQDSIAALHEANELFKTVRKDFKVLESSTADTLPPPPTVGAPL